MSATLAEIYTNVLTNTAQQLLNDHGVKTIGDLSRNLSLLKKYNGKLDFNL